MSGSAISAIESMEIGTYITSHLVPSMTWMPMWQHSLEMRLGTCGESWVEQKAILIIPISAGGTNSLSIQYLAKYLKLNGG